ncbi:MAG: lipoprotein [Dysgonomonas sp.]|nr:lipoprotein [Dysgonomonas sp.]
MNRFVLFLGIIFLLAGCNTKTSKVNEEQVADQINDEIEKDWIVAPSDSGYVHLNLIDGKGKLQIHKEKDKIIYIVFQSKGYNKVSAKLSSADSLANIRFSQIFLPDGTMDGPFGRDLDYKLPSDGEYKVSVHENMMAGDPWGGNFFIEVVLSNNK